MATVTFSECIAPATEEDIAELEARLGIQIPLGVLWLFDNFNGGMPKPNVFANEDNSIDVFACLEIRRGKGSVLSNYEQLVLKRKLVPSHFLPFAYSSGSDTYFVDCLSEGNDVYIYYEDTAFEHLNNLRVSFEDFWNRLEE